MEEIYEGGNSKARNPKMQDMLRMIGLGENLGSGFPKIIDAWKDVKWDSPMLEDRLSLNEVRLTLPVLFAEITTETTTETILEYIRQNPKITTKELASLTGMTNDGVYYHIKKLKKAERIKRDGAERNGGQWIVL